MASVRVRLFAGHREAARRAEVMVELPEGATVAVLRRQLERAVPALKALERSTLVAVNGEFAPDGRPVRASDDVAVFPPVAGG
jgi:molybdopterin converting factor subunit 1